MVSNLTRQSGAIEFVSLGSILILMMALALSEREAELLHKTCEDNDTFSIMSDSSFGTCIFECQRRRRCVAIMHRHGMNACSLKDFVDFSLLTDNKPICTYTNISTWSRHQLGPCSANECGTTETCELSTTDPIGFKCVKTECPRPAAINNATLMSTVHAIGYTNAYKCDLNYAGTGNSAIICNNDTTWTATNFECIRLCPRPKRIFENAELESINGNGFYMGCVLQFKCRSEYQALGTTASSMCTSKGRWSTSVVECCSNTYTELWKKTCIQTVAVGLAFNTTEMMDDCEKIGGRARAIDNQLAEHVLTGGVQFNWLMSSITKSDFAKRYDLRKCLAENMDVIELDMFINDTYNDLVRLITERGMQDGKHCKQAYLWADGQPDGGDEHNCVRVGNESSYLMDDVPCELQNNTGFICYTDLSKIHV